MQELLELLAGLRAKWWDEDTIDVWEAQKSHQVESGVWSPCPVEACCLRGPLGDLGPSTVLGAPPPSRTILSPTLAGRLIAVGWSWPQRGAPLLKSLPKTVGSWFGFSVG